MDDSDVFYSKEIIDKVNALLDDCIHTSKLSMLSIESKAKIYKLDLLRGCKLLQTPFNKEKKDLEDINNYKKDYNRGFLPSFYKLAGYTIFRSVRKNLPGKILYSGKYLVAILINKNIIFSFRQTTDKVEWLDNLNPLKSRFYPKDSDEFFEWKEEFIQNNGLYYIAQGEKFDDKFLLHRGIHLNFRNGNYNFIIDSCIKMSGVEKPFIVFTGISKGGVLSTIAGVYLAQHHPELKFSILTFSTPPIFNNLMSLYTLYLSIKKKKLINYIRVINRGDALLYMKTKEFVGSWIHKSTFWNKHFGSLCHATTFVPEKYKIKINNIKQKLKKNFITIDCEDFSQKILDKCSSRTRKMIRHTVYTFTSRRAGILFSY
tara:strand:- start:868 stop:1986 length:1119 start_codon:yes stop_codon:yes gene_type:complete